MAQPSSTLSHPSEASTSKAMTPTSPIEFIRVVPITAVLEARKKLRGGNIKANFPPLDAIPDSATVKDAIIEFQKTGRKALPLYRTDNKSDFIGILTVNDILTFASFGNIFDALHKTEVSVDEQDKAVQEASQVFFSKPVVELLSITTESSHLWNLTSADPCSNLFDVLKSDKRVLVKNAENESEWTVVSQRDLLNYICDNAKEIVGIQDIRSLPATDVMNLALKEKGPDPNQAVHPESPERLRYVISVEHDVTALTAFRTMVLHRMSGLPIIDRDSKALLGNLSVSDFVWAIKVSKEGGSNQGVEALNELLGPVIDFSKKVHQHKKLSGLYAVKETEKLDKVVDILLQTAQIHHVWVATELKEGVEGSMSGQRWGKPVGSVSLSDVLATVGKGFDVGKVVEE